MGGSKWFSLRLFSPKLPRLRIAAACLPGQYLAVHGDINAGRQALHGADGDAEVDGRVGVGEALGAHGAGQDDHFTGNAVEGGGALEQGICAVGDDDAGAGCRLAGAAQGGAVVGIDVEAVFLKHRLQLVGKSGVEPFQDTQRGGWADLEGVTAQRAGVVLVDGAAGLQEKDVLRAYSCSGCMARVSIR